MCPHLQALIVGETAKWRCLVEQALHRQGWRVTLHRAQNAHEFSRLLKSDPQPEMIFVEECGDFNATRALKLRDQSTLRDGPAASPIPLFVLTRDDNDEAYERWMQSGADDVLSFDRPARFAFAIGAALERHRLRHSAQSTLHALSEHEKRFHALLENSSDGIALVNAAGCIVFASPSTSRILGYGQHELQRCQLADLLMPEVTRPVPLPSAIVANNVTDAAAILKALPFSLRRFLPRPNQVQRREARVRHKDGTSRWLEITVKNLLHEPAVGAIVINYHDISARKNVEETLRQREHDLHAMFDNVLAAVLVTDEAGAYLEQNPGAHMLLGLAPDAVVNLSAHDFMAPEVRHLVPSLRDFRDLFADNSGEESGVEVCTKALFFSDLKGSAQLYEDSGDAPAYDLVRSHFDYVFGIIARAQGAVVKTIGDAVMAVFDEPEAAVQACLEMQSGVDAFNTRLAAQGGDERPLIIKIGLHFGPVIAVKADHRFDYFGRTVNIAARLTAASIGHDIVMSAAVFERPAMKAIFDRFGTHHSMFQGNLKGIQEVFTLYRVQV